MMIIVGGFSLLVGIARMVMFAVHLAPGELELVGPRRSGGVILNMALMVFGLLVMGLGILWTVAGTLS